MDRCLYKAQWKDSHWCQKTSKWAQEESTFRFQFQNLQLLNCLFSKNKIKSMSSSPVKVILDNFKVLQKEGCWRFQWGEGNLHDILARHRFIIAKSRWLAVERKITSFRFPVCSTFGDVLFPCFKSLYSVIITKLLRENLTTEVKNNQGPSSSFYFSSFCKTE